MYLSWHDEDIPVTEAALSPLLFSCVAFGCCFSCHSMLPSSPPACCLMQSGMCQVFPSLPPCRLLALSLSFFLSLSHTRRYTMHVRVRGSERKQKAKWIKYFIHFHDRTDKVSHVLWLLSNTATPCWTVTDHKSPTQICLLLLCEW